MSGKLDGKVAVITGGNIGDDIPTIGSVFDLKSGARAKLVDRSGSMVIIEVEGYRSDWMEWSEVRARVAKTTGDDRDD